MRGIYVIICWANSVVYVGHSTCIDERWKTHRRDLTGNYHHCDYLQRAWNKYGEAAFEFGVHKEMPGATIQELVDAETHLWELWEGDRFSDVKPGMPPSCNPIVAAKISASHKGKTVTPEARAKISAALKGRPKSAETRARMSAAAKGRVFTPETRAKMSFSLKGRTIGPEHRAKLSAAMKGRNRGPLSKEHRAKIGAANKGRPSHLRGRKLTPEHRAKISATLKGARP